MQTEINREMKMMSESKAKLRVISIYRKKKKCPWLGNQLEITVMPPGFDKEIWENLLSSFLAQNPAYIPSKLSFSTSRLPPLFVFFF